jgi:formylglycine-generating enzyme required for sulfatase activity
VGDGWEWTATPFAPFPGFEPMGGYEGYSADFFDGRHYVLLGASWATDDLLARRSFRNWFQPHYPYVFAKFRCVR